MAEDAPGWKQTFDAFERMVGPELEALVRQEPFQDAFATWTRIQQRARSSFARSLHDVWLTWGISPSDDVARLSAQIAALEQEVRDLRAQLEDADGAAAGPRRARRPARS